MTIRLLLPWVVVARPERTPPAASLHCRALLQVLRCINLMITSRQQELASATALASSAANLQGDNSQPSHAGTTGPLAMSDAGAATDAGATIVSTSSSNGEWDIVRVGSMRDVSGGSAAATSSRSHAARLGSKLLLPSGQQAQQLQGPGQLSGWQQQKQKRQGVAWSSDCTSVVSGQQTEGSNRLRCTDSSWAVDSDHGHGPQDL